MTHPMHLVSLASMSLTTNVANAPIEFAPVDSTRAVTLTLAEGIYNGPTVQQRTRMFNGQILGPTIVVRPGETTARRSGFCDRPNADKSIAFKRFVSRTYLCHPKKFS